MAFDPIAAQSELYALEQPSSANRSPKQGYDRKKLLRLIPLVTAAMKGGPGAVEGLLAGFQQAEAQKQQQARLAEQDQRGIDQQTFSRNFQLAQFNRQGEQQEAEQTRRLEADRRALTGELNRALTGVDTPEATRALLELYRPRFEALQIPQGQFEAAVLEQNTPSRLEVRQAQAKLEEAKKLYGPAAHRFSYTLAGESQPVGYEELERRAGFQRDPDAPPRDQQAVGNLTEFENFFANDWLPAVYDERRVAGNTTPLTRAEIRDQKLAAQREWTAAGRAPRANTGRQQTVTERRQQEQRLDERVAYLLRNPARGNRQAWAEVRRGYEGLGVDFSTRRDSVARRVEREDRQGANSDPLAAVATAAERIAASDAALAGAPASPPANRPGATPPPPTRTATRAEVEAVAQRQGVSFTEAKRQLEARGVRVAP